MAGQPASCCPGALGRISKPSNLINGPLRGNRSLRRPGAALAAPGPGREIASAAMLSATAPIVLLLHGGLDNLPARRPGPVALRPGDSWCVVIPGHAGGSLEAIHRHPAVGWPVVAGSACSSSPMGPRWAVGGAGLPVERLPAGLRKTCGRPRRRPCRWAHGLPHPLATT